MTTPSVTLGEPLLQDMATHSTRRAAKALLFFSIGLGLAVLLAMMPGADMSGRPHSAVSMASMASMMPQRQAAIGKAAVFQSRPLSSLRPSLSRQNLKPMQVSVDAAPRTLGETKRAFEAQIPRFLPSLAQSFVLEYLNDLHFYVFGPTYKYDALFALGLREIFAAGSKLAGSGDPEDLWKAICIALELDPAQTIKDAETMRDYANSTGPDDILKQMEGPEKPSDSVVAAAFEGSPKHSQFRSVGLLRVMEYSGFKMDKEKAAEWAKAAKIDNAKFIKDLQSYRKNIIKMKEGEEMLKGMAEREAKKKAESQAKAA